MLAPPSLKSLPQYPVTAGLAALAMVVTGTWWTGQPIDWAIMDDRVFARWELWRALTSILPHAGIFHLAFNLYWLWTFGTLVERVYGHLRCAGIYLLLGAVSSLAQFSLLSDGVGLSGVGYGLWGLLWVLDRRDPRFAGAVDPQTSRLFVVWFFVCIVLTLANVMPVANVAHGVGAVKGALLGFAVSSEDLFKRTAITGLVAASVLFLAGATVFWPWVNLSVDAEVELEAAGYDALQANDDQAAVTWLEIAVHKRNATARAWYNLGVAYQDLKRYDDAAAAYDRAAGLGDADSEMKQTAKSFRAYFSRDKYLKNHGAGESNTNLLLDFSTNH